MPENVGSFSVPTNFSRTNPLLCDPAKPNSSTDSIQARPSTFNLPSKTPTTLTLGSTTLTTLSLGLTTFDHDDQLPSTMEETNLFVYKNGRKRNDYE